MIVYHGSTEIVEKPDIKHSYRALDFGMGFYVTTIREQAERWARRKASILGKDKAIVNLYQMNENTGGLRVVDMYHTGIWDKERAPRRLRSILPMTRLLLLRRRPSTVCFPLNPLRRCGLMDEKALEWVYQGNLEERIIAYLSDIKNISLETAMNIYYHSVLADKIYHGVEGIQYLDYKVLAQI